MTENDGQPAPVAEVDAPIIPAQDAPEPGTFVNADGTLKDGWKDLIPEDFRGLKVYDTFQDVSGLLKQVGNQSKVIGQQGKGIMLPGDKATATEMELYYKAIGRPDKAEAYKIESPKGLESYYDPQFVGAAQQTFHSIGLTPKQAAGLVDWYNKQLADGVTKQQQETDARHASGLEKLQKEWGLGFEPRKAILQKVLADNMDKPEDKDAIEAAINDCPELAEVLANVGKKFMEAPMLSADAAATASMTPAESLNRARELMATPGFAKGQLPEATRTRIQGEVDKLYRQAEGKV